MKSLAFVASPIMDVNEEGAWFPTMQDADRESPQLGVYLLAGRLKKAGWIVEIIDWVAMPGVAPAEIATKIAKFEVALFSANSMNWASALHVCRAARRINPNLKTCVGGPHPTHYPVSVIASGSFDCYFRGEADSYIALIADSLFSDSRPTIRVPGLGWSVDGESGIPETHTEQLLDPIDWEPAYDSIPSDTFLVLPVETSRGCKFQCSFCSIPQKKNWRAYSDSSGIHKLNLANKYSYKARTGILSIVDDTFTTDHYRVERICDGLDPGAFSGRLMYDATLVDARNENMVRALAPFTSDLLLGAEVSSKEDGKRIRKASNPKIIFEAAEVLQKFDISRKAVFSFIIGFPWHTKADCLRTIILAKDLALNYGARIYIQWYWPMPGSEIWRDLESKGLVNLEMMDVPGFFRRQEWFFPIRGFTIKDMQDIDDRILAVQSVLDIYSGDRRHRPLEYGSPLRMWSKQRVNRNPSMVRSAET
ncbi:B12-binding domain-containing radical SAM protein [Pseudomonas aeruginosa]